MEVEPATPISAPRKLSAAAIRRRHDRYNRNIQREIDALQKSSTPIIPYTSFSRVVHEELDKHGEYSIRGEAVRALQEAAEGRVTEMFQEANNLARYSGRETVSGKDMMFICPPGPPAADSTEPPLIVQDQ